MRSSISRTLAVAPREMVYGGTYRRTRAAIRRSETDSQFVHDFQTAALRSLLGDALHRSSFYRDHLPAGLDVEGFSINDLAGLDLLNRDMVQDQCEAMLVVPRSAVDEVTTGGTSGRPLRVLLDKDRSPREWAFDTHVWARRGYDLSSRRAVLRGLPIPRVDSQPWEWEPGLRELRLSPFHLSEQTTGLYLELIGRYRINYLHGYPSAISILALHAQSLEWTSSPSLKGILPISEPLYPHQRDLFMKVFGSPVIAPFYGLSEKVCMAGEVAGLDGTYEFEPLYGVAQLVAADGSTVATPGVRGRIVGTGLLSRGMPLIRYDTGDDARLVRSATLENCYRMRVDNIVSRRKREFLVSADGALIPTTAINIHSPAYALVRECQFRQERVGEVDLLLVPRVGVTLEDVSAIAVEIQRKVGRRLAITPQLVESIAVSPRGKRAWVDQRLDLSAFGERPPAT